MPDRNQKSSVRPSINHWQGSPLLNPFPATAAVFVIKVNNISAVSNPNADLQQQRFMQEQQQRSRITYGLVDALRKLATIEDNRGKFF